MFEPGEIISYMQMCQQEGASLQRGMNFGLGGEIGVILMSVRRGAPYSDRVEDEGKTVIYEGHDAARTEECPKPKLIDQPENLPSGTPTQNGLFWKAALAHKDAGEPPARFRVYEKIRTGIWAYAGLFELVDAWKEKARQRQVYKFKLRVCEEQPSQITGGPVEIAHNRMIPTDVKQAVWKRDKGKCVLCGSKENLHFDHILPFSKGGTSLLARNIQLLCARHNLGKRDRIE